MHRSVNVRGLVRAVGFLVWTGLLAAGCDDGQAPAAPADAGLDAAAGHGGGDAGGDAGADDAGDAGADDAGDAGADAGDAGADDAGDAAAAGSTCLLPGIIGAPAIPSTRGDCGLHPPADACAGNGASDPGTPGLPACLPGTSAVAAILWCVSPTDIWATNIEPAGSLDEPETKLLHHDGTGWQTISSLSQTYLQSVSGRHDDVWVVGHLGHLSWYHRLIVFHWNGSQLQSLILPANTTSSPVDPLLQSWHPQVWAGPDTRSAPGAPDTLWIGGDTAWHLPTPVAPACFSDP